MKRYIRSSSGIFNRMENGNKVEALYEFLPVDTSQYRQVLQDYGLDPIDETNEYFSSILEENYGLEYAGVLFAKPEFEDELGNDGLDMLVVAKDLSSGKYLYGITKDSDRSFNPIGIDRYYENLVELDDDTY